MDRKTTIKPSFISKIFLIPSENRLRSGWRILILGCFILISILLFSPLFLITAVMDMNPAGYLLLSAVSTALPITISVFITRKWIDRRSFSSLGVQTSRGRGQVWRTAWRDIFNGIWISALMFTLIFLLEWIMGWVQIEGLNLSQSSFTGGNLDNNIFISLIIILFAFVLVGWNEELLFRGYLLVNIREGLNLFWAVILSSVAFAFMHSLNPNITWEATVGLAISGIFFAYCTLWSKRLWLPIGLHIGWNFMQGAIFGLPVSGVEINSILNINVTGPEFFTGGAFGPEAGLILLPGIALGFLIVRMLYRNRS